jgi:hypothetical protein
VRLSASTSIMQTLRTLFLLLACLILAAVRGDEALTPEGELWGIWDGTGALTKSAECNCRPVLCCAVALDDTKTFWPFVSFDPTRPIGTPKPHRQLQDLKADVVKALEMREAKRNLRGDADMN